MIYSRSETLIFPSVHYGEPHWNANSMAKHTT